MGSLIPDEYHRYLFFINWQTSQAANQSLLIYGHYLEDTGEPMVDEALDGNPSGNGSSGKDVVS